MASDFFGFTIFRPSKGSWFGLTVHRSSLASRLPITLLLLLRPARPWNMDSLSWTRQRRGGQPLWECYGPFAETDPLYQSVLSDNSLESQSYPGSFTCISGEAQIALLRAEEVPSECVRRVGMSDWHWPWCLRPPKSLPLAAVQMLAKCTESMGRSFPPLKTFPVCDCPYNNLPPSLANPYSWPVHRKDAKVMGCCFRAFLSTWMHACLSCILLLPWSGF